MSVCTGILTYNAAIWGDPGETASRSLKVEYELIVRAAIGATRGPDGQGHVSFLTLLDQALPSRVICAPSDHPPRVFRQAAAQRPDRPLGALAGHAGAGRIHDSKNKVHNLLSIRM